MADTRARPWEADESSRSRDSKVPRLDLLAASAAEEEEKVKHLLGQEECTEMTGHDPCCDHVPTDSYHNDILISSLLSDDAGNCQDCRGRRREEADGPGGRPMYRRIMVCLECGRHSCGDSTSYIPYGHAQDHANQEKHWVAAMFDDPQAGFCFKCEHEVPVYPEPDEMEMITGEIQAGGGGGGGGHAFGFDMSRDLATVLLNLGDAWCAAADLGSVNAQGYAIRGMPNRGNTCYMNAMVQCLLALDKLRARMLGPDTPPGHLGMALKELFVEASAAGSAGGMLNPDKLLRSVRLHAGKYEPYTMHDSYELLESLRSALHDEEEGIQAPYRERGAPTVIDAVFKGELCDTRSCKDCQSASAFHGEFWELSLSLPSKEDLCENFASSSQRASKNLNPQPEKAAPQLLSANESNLCKIDASKTGDFHLLVSELNGLIGTKHQGPWKLVCRKLSKTQTVPL